MSKYEFDSLDEELEKKIEELHLLFILCSLLRIGIGCFRAMSSIKNSKECDLDE